MEHSIHINKKFKIPQIGKIPLYVIIVIVVFLLAVLQDFIYSRIKQTGFYLSESMLYNTFWAFFIPFTILINQLIKVINPKNKPNKLPFNVGIGIAFSFLHILAFSALFSFVSYLVFTPSHRFAHMFNTALANQLYIALLYYIIFPAVYIFKQKPTSLTSGYAEKIKIKAGSKIITILTSEIQLISTDKPYSTIHLNDRKYLDNRSLKAFESQLDPSIFLRVHRSTIINGSYIKKLESRHNGDYDATLENGQSIRLSRHYRSNWHQLLQ